MQELTTLDAKARLVEPGFNILPEARPPSFLLIFVRQSLSPLNYILVAAAAVPMTIGDAKDAVFIALARRRRFGQNTGEGGRNGPYRHDPFRLLRR
jgi:magnesium-transporting ATPase (P-type)